MIPTVPALPVLMNDLIAFWHSYPVVSGAVLMALFNLAVTSMPTPKENGSPWYLWAFNFAHALVLAIPRIINANKQGETDAK